MERTIDTYRGCAFMVESSQQLGQDRPLWRGHFRLLDSGAPGEGGGRSVSHMDAPLEAHQWVPLQPEWATHSEARMNAIEAAHAAIDARAAALTGQPFPPFD